MTKLLVLLSSLVFLTVGVSLKSAHAGKPFTPPQIRDFEVCGPPKAVTTSKGYPCNLVTYQSLKDPSLYVCKAYAGGEEVSRASFTIINNQYLEIGTVKTVGTTTKEVGFGLRGYSQCVYNNMLEFSGFPDYVVSKNGWVMINQNVYFDNLIRLKRAGCDPRYIHNEALKGVPSVQCMLKNGYVPIKVEGSVSQVVYCKNACTPIKWVNGRPVPNGGPGPWGYLGRPIRMGKWPLGPDTVITGKPITSFENLESLRCARIGRQLIAIDVLIETGLIGLDTYLGCANGQTFEDSLFTTMREKYYLDPSFFKTNPDELWAEYGNECWLDKTPLEGLFYQACWGAGIRRNDAQDLWYDINGALEGACSGFSSSVGGFWDSIENLGLPPITR